MALSNIKVSIATALIGSIAFGIVVDDTIHFLTRFNVNRLKGLTVTASVAETLEVIGRSIVTTTLILVGSFITLSSSSFLPSAHFGIFIALSVSLALYLDIFILPLVIPRICREKASL
jgi:predicted RND superfamily exporter protein